jgi:hypothetical protein
MTSNGPSNYTPDATTAPTHAGMIRSAAVVAIKNSGVLAAIGVMLGA